jgi:outer membrane protein assembly factor BamB
MAIAVGLMTSTAALAAADWPQWRGPNRDGLSAETGLLPEWPESGPPLLWSASGLGAGFAGVSIADGRIFTMGDRGGQQHVIALSASDGREIWSLALGSPSYDDSHVGPRCTPTVSKDLVFAVGSEGVVVAAEAATGRERWRRNLVSDFGGRMMSMWRFAESPLVDGNRVIVTPGVRGAGLVALDRATGKEIWRTALPDLGSRGHEGAAYSSVVVSNGGGVKQYVQLVGRGLIGVRASDGRFLWGYNRIANGTANIPTPIVRGNHVFTSTGYGTGAALLELSASGDGVAAKEVYFLDAGRLQNHHGGLVLVGDHLYAGHGHNRGIPICVEFATGKVVWGGDIRNGASGSAAVVFADDRLYFRYQDGTMMLIEATPAGYRERGRYAIPGVRAPSWPHPVVSDGKLYLREQDALHVYDVRVRRGSAAVRGEAGRTY